MFPTYLLVLFLRRPKHQISLQPASRGMTHDGPPHPMLSCFNCCLTLGLHFPHEESAMPPKRSSPDADNVLGQPPRRVSARRASTPGLPEQGRGLRHIPPEAIVWGMKSTTCLSLGLDPVNADHKPVVCDNCTAYWQMTLQKTVTRKG